MLQLGLRSIITKFFKPYRNKLGTKNDNSIINLIKGMKIDNMNQVWTTDISYIKTKEDNNVYFISFIDMYSRKVIAYDIFQRQTTENVIEVLKTAIKRNKPSPGLIIHSDKGSQMRSDEYIRFLEKHRFIRSYTSINHSCDENAAHESFHSLLKREQVYQLKIKNLVEAKRVISDYIDNFYNKSRIHNSLGGLSPIQYEKLTKKHKIPL